jgi:hypothetical protein
MGDSELLERCRGILVKVLGEFVGVGVDKGRLWGMEMGGLMQQAEGLGFWGMQWLPGVQRNGIEGVGMVDRYTTPPGQTLWRGEEMQMD